MGLYTNGLIHEEAYIQRFTIFTFRQFWKKVRDSNNLEIYVLSGKKYVILTIEIINNTRGGIVIFNPVKIRERGAKN
jgi:hypothetical protein